MATPRTWHKAFVTLPAAWRVLTYFQRSLMQDYWRLSAADCSGQIETAGDPVQFLVRMLDLSSKGDRSAAIRETAKLFERGLLAVVSPSLVEVRTAQNGSCSSVVPATFHTQLPTSVPNDAGTTQVNSAKLFGTGLTDREKEENRERERARERAREDLDSLLGSEPDPSRQEPPLQVIVAEHAKRYAAARSGEKCLANFQAASKLLKWCEANAAVHKSKPLPLALKAVGGLFASAKAAEKRWPLAYAAYDPAEYLPPPPGTKAVPAAASSQHSTHSAYREWEEPEWMRGAAQ